MRAYDAYANFQVLGQNLRNIVSGLGSFWRLASRFMLEENLGTLGPDGLVQFDLEKWYPLAGNLRVFARIQKDFGEVALRQMAAHVPEFASFPPSVVDIHTAFATLDAAYHMNHAFNEHPMFSLQTGVMLEGIGHYRARSIPEQKHIRCECTNPYPCCFDQGLLLALAQRFEPSAVLMHLEPARCRARGASRCTYSITWT